MKKFILAIGPVTKDHIITPDDEYTQIGGAVYYQTMTLTQLKMNVSSIISIGENDTGMLNPILQKQQIIKTTTTQEYTNIYDKNLNRTQKAKLPRNPIKPEDIKINLKNISYALISPLSPYDIPSETIKYLKEENITTILVAQGYLRKTDKDNNIIPKTWTDKQEYLRYTDIICLDKNEALQAFQIKSITENNIREIIRKNGLKQVIITLAEQGSKIYTENNTYNIPAIKTNRIVDATGLGDTYIAAYIAKLQETSNIRISGLYASISAKEKLENKGPLRANKEKIEKELDNYR